MRIVKILSLIFFFGAAFFGALQLFNNIRGVSSNLSLQAIWRQATTSNGDALRDLMPSGFFQDLVSSILASPAWLASLVTAVALWVLARAVGDDD